MKKPYWIRCSRSHSIRNEAERKIKTGLGAATGMVVCGLLMGPLFTIEMVVGETVGGMATKDLANLDERHKQRVNENPNFRKYSSKQSEVVTCNVVFV